MAAKLFGDEGVKTMAATCPRLFGGEGLRVPPARLFGDEGVEARTVAPRCSTTRLSRRWRPGCSGDEGVKARAANCPKLIGDEGVQRRGRQGACGQAVQ